MARQATLTIKLDGALKREVTKLFKERGTSVETFIRLQLKAMTCDKTILRLEDKMNFGKYYGEPVEDVVRTNPGYVSWILANSSTPKFGPDVIALLEELNA